MTEDFRNLFFQCAAKRARSIMTEALSNGEGTRNFKTCSAGSNPRFRTHPPLDDLQMGLNPDSGSGRSASWGKIHPAAPRVNFAPAICDNAAAQECPVRRGQPPPTDTHFPKD